MQLTGGAVKFAPTGEAALGPFPGWWGVPLSLLGVLQDRCGCLTAGEWMGSGQQAGLRFGPGLCSRAWLGFRSPEVVLGLPACSHQLTLSLCFSSPAGRHGGDPGVSVPSPDGRHHGAEVDSQPADERLCGGSGL